jgi:large subunit ribosomal protein L46
MSVLGHGPSRVDPCRPLHEAWNVRSHTQNCLFTGRRWTEAASQQRNFHQSHSVCSLYSNYPFILRNAHLPFPHQQSRAMAKAAAAAKTAADGTSKEPSYWEQKKAKKDRRRELFLATQERKKRLKVRRAGKPIDTKKVEFHKFFISKKVTDEFLDRKARQAGLEWKIKAAAILERIEIVLPDKQPWEVEYENLKTHLNRFGKQYPKEFTGGYDYDEERPMTDEDLLKLLPFTPAPRETEADASGDLRTTDRKLKTNIYLAVQEKNSELWQMPTVDLKENESLLDAVRRTLPNQLGPDIDFWCPSNAPWTVQLTPYSEEERKSLGFYGFKTFFMKVQLHEGGSVSPKHMKVKDFAWLDRGEMVDRVREQQGEEMSKFYYYML